MSIIAYLRKTDDEAYEGKLKKVFKECLPFDSLKTLLASKAKISAIAINESDHDELVNSIKELRRSDKYLLTPIIVQEEKDDDAFLFADGNFENLQSFLKKCDKINKLISQLKGRKAHNWKDKLLLFLYTRPDLLIAPVAHWQTRMYYSYPFVDMFCVDVENYFFWLDDLAKDGFLSIEKLVDQVFSCPFCFSAHLKFTDHCPNCNSINIGEENFLHCFTCGLVSPQNEFLKNDRFVCPRCNSKLKHIGDDYDRPLENGVCNDCNFYYTDTTLMSKCMICQKESSPDSLVKKAFFEYKLTEMGKDHVRSNTVDVKAMLSDSENYVNLQYFYAILDWLIAMFKRANEIFSVIGFKLQLDSDEFKYEKVHEFADYLRKLLRTTDFCTRINEESFWFILPRTDAKNLEIVKSRILEKYNTLLGEKEPGKELKIVQYTSSEKESLKEENSKVLIATLGTEL